MQIPFSSHVQECVGSQAHLGATYKGKSSQRWFYIRNIFQIRSYKELLCEAELSNEWAIKDMTQCLAGSFMGYMVLSR